MFDAEEDIADDEEETIAEEEDLDVEELALLDRLSAVEGL